MKVAESNGIYCVAAFMDSCKVHEVLEIMVQQVSFVD